MTRRRLVFGVLAAPFVLVASAYIVGLAWSSSAITEDEYAVYSAVLEDYFVTNATGHEGNPEWIVIRSQTTRHWNLLLAPVGLLIPTAVTTRIEGLPLSASWSWAAKNFRQQPLERRLNTTLPYVLLPSAEIDSEEQPEVLAQYAVIPAAGYVQLTRVGFDGRRRFAFVYFEHVCGLCGGGYHALLERIDGGWEVVDKAWTWVS